MLQVQPDLVELEVNMEDNEDAESNKSEVKLGKLQFSLDYDFTKGEVSSRRRRRRCRRPVTSFTSHRVSRAAVAPCLYLVPCFFKSQVCQVNLIYV